MNRMEIQRPAVHVAVGVIRNSLGEILLARRHGDAHQGGLWEFPGGKLEAGETVESALRRELREELGIAVDAASPLIKIAHDYGNKRVLLDVWQVDAFRGEPCGMENQPVRWTPPEALAGLEFPAANRPIVAAARLPDCYPIVDGGVSGEDGLFGQLERLCRLGYPLAQWRVKHLRGEAYLALARRAVEFCRPRGLGLLLNAEPEEALKAGAAGVHLNGGRLQTLARRPLPASLWVAASCHGPEDIRQARQAGVDFIVLSPVLPTPSHPDSPPLGWERFGLLAEAAGLPVYALGGMERAHLAQARRHGARGVAGIRGFL
jgi:8-oxo-dGTP diphosphatase